MKKKNPLNGKSPAQAGQDLFALEVCKNKTYIEIGGNSPTKINNTYRLDKLGWQGFSIELNTKWQERWKESDRNNSCYFENALTFDYAAALQQNGISNSVGYLSCDIEPPENTFAALKRVIGQGIDFECITFEHDWYNYKDTDFHSQACAFLEPLGYKVAVYDVFCKKSWDHYETWFVKNSINYEKIQFIEWRSKIAQSPLASV